MTAPMPDPALLIELGTATMPFGKYSGRTLLRVPEEYLLWFKDRGFPSGKLGLQMQQMLEIKINGLEPLVEKAVRLAGKG